MKEILGFAVLAFIASAFLATLKIVGLADDMAWNMVFLPFPAFAVLVAILAAGYWSLMGFFSFVGWWRFRRHIKDAE